MGFISNIRDMLKPPTKSNGERAISTLSFDQWLTQQSIYGSMSVQGRTGPDSEGEPNDFNTYANRFYKGNPVVFGLSQIRMRVFSEMEFKFLPLSASEDEHSLFGTRELEILEKPWPGGTTQDLCSRALQDIDLCGNFFVTREGKRLRRLRPDWVDILLSADANVAVASDVVGYAYYPGGFGKPGGGPVIYLPEEVGHWAPIPDPIAQYRGMSWITPALKAIMVEEGAQQHRLDFFQRGARPSIAITFDDKVTGEQGREFREYIESEHTGVGNSWRPLFLGHGADITPLEVSLEDLDMKNISGRAENHLALASGVHSTVAGLLEGMAGSSLNAGNYKVAAKGFAQTTMRPLWRSFCGSMQTVVNMPTGRPSKLWWSDRSVAILNDNLQEQADIRQRNATTMETLWRSGFTAESVQAFIISGNYADLEHSGVLSVQTQGDGTGKPMEDPSTSVDKDKPEPQEQG